MHKLAILIAVFSLSVSAAEIKQVPIPIGRLYEVCHDGVIYLFFAKGRSGGLTPKLTPHTGHLYDCPKDDEKE